jgi:hypothetical protein
VTDSPWTDRGDRPEAGEELEAGRRSPSGLDVFRAAVFRSRRDGGKLVP